MIEKESMRRGELERTIMIEKESMRKEREDLERSFSHDIERLNHEKEKWIREHMEKTQGEKEIELSRTIEKMADEYNQILEQKQQEHLQLLLSKDKEFEGRIEWVEQKWEWVKQQCVKEVADIML